MTYLYLTSIAPNGGAIKSFVSSPRLSCVSSSCNAHVASYETWLRYPVWLAGQNRHCSH
jgi:hypothetical protein